MMRRYRLVLRLRLHDRLGLDGNRRRAALQARRLRRHHFDQLRLDGVVRWRLRQRGPDHRRAEQHRGYRERSQWTGERKPAPRLRAIDLEQLGLDDGSDPLIHDVTVSPPREASKM